MVTIHVEVQQCYTTLATIDPRFKHIFLSRLGFYKATEQTASSPLYHEVIISNGIEIFDAESFRDPDFRFGVCPSCLRALKNSKLVEKTSKTDVTPLPARLRYYKHRYVCMFYDVLFYVVYS